MAQDEKQYWFPAKTYGWGWGPPVTWQGWLVLVGWVVAVTIASIVTLVPTQRWMLFCVLIVLLTFVLVAVCWWKGEPPRWRWGGP